MSVAVLSLLSERVIATWLWRYMWCNYCRLTKWQIKSVQLLFQLLDKKTLSKSEQISNH
jgi:hypothetical protein